MKVMKYIILFMVVVFIATLSTCCIIRVNRVTANEARQTAIRDSIRTANDIVLLIEDFDVSDVTVVCNNGTYYVEIDSIIAHAETFVANAIIRKMERKGSAKFDVVINDAKDYEVVKR